MIRKVLYVLLAAFLYSVFTYAVHLLVDNAGADVGTAARVVYKLKDDPSFIFTINQDGVKHGLSNDASEDELLRNDTYVCGPKFAPYTAAAAIYSICGIAWPGADPLSALFITSLICLFGCAVLTCLILMRSGYFAGKTFVILSPVLFFSMPTIYYLAFYPTYLFMLTFLLLAAIYLVMRSYENEKSSSGKLLLSGTVLGLSIGTGPQAVVCIFAVVVFTGVFALSKRFFLKSLLMQSAGILVAVALSELAFQANGASLFKWVWLHTHENIYDNHLKGPFPFIPLVYFRILYALLPLTLAAFIGGLCLSKMWWKNVTSEGKSLFISLLIVLATLSVLPNTPLFRVFFPFFIVIQLCIFMVIMNIKRKTVRYSFIMLLLLETALNLPSSLFIRIGPSEHNSPIMPFEDERKIIKYFNYVQPEALPDPKEQTEKPSDLHVLADHGPEPL
jgi:hypothetical protein